MFYTKTNITKSSRFKFELTLGLNKIEFNFHASKKITMSGGA